MHSISYRLHTAKFPIHRDLAGFDFEHSKSDQGLITDLSDLSFTEAANNVVFIGGTDTGKTHLATALGVSGITQHSKRVRFYSTVDLVNFLEQEKAAGKAGKLAFALMRMDLVILDDLSYVRRDQAETSVLFELIAERYERKSLALTANQPFSGWDQVFPDTAMTLAAVDRLVHHSTIFELNVESYRRRAAARGCAPVPLRSTKASPRATATTKATSKTAAKTKATTIANPRPTVSG